VLDLLRTFDEWPALFAFCSVEAPAVRTFGEGFDMKGIASITLITVLFLAIPLYPVLLSAGSDDFQNLEFSQERSPKNTKDSTERHEIVNRFLFKALDLLYHQKPEQLRLDRQTLNVLKELRDVKVREARELENFMSKS
jgi:hypothetical protein